MKRWATLKTKKRKLLALEEPEPKDLGTADNYCIDGNDGFTSQDNFTHGESDRRSGRSVDCRLIEGKGKSRFPKKVDIKPIMELPEQPGLKRLHTDT